MFMKKFNSQKGACCHCDIIDKDISSDEAGNERTVPLARRYYEEARRLSYGDQAITLKGYGHKAYYSLSKKHNPW
jgi:hypothetical protein